MGLLYFSPQIHIEFLCMAEVLIGPVLDFSVMNLITVESWPRRKAFSKFPSRQAVGDDFSDVWPDRARALNESELAMSADRNRPSTVLWDAVRAVVGSVAIVVALMALLAVFHIR